MSVAEISIVEFSQELEKIGLIVPELEIVATLPAANELRELANKIPQAEADNE